MITVQSAAKEVLDSASLMASFIEKSVAFHLTRHEITSQILMLAWLDFVRRGWDGAISGDLDAQKKTAKELTKQSHDRDDIVCMPYAGPAMICNVDGKHVVCIEALVAGAVPLWVHYFQKVREAVEIAKKVAE